MKFFKKHSR